MQREGEDIEWKAPGTYPGARLKESTWRTSKHAWGETLPPSGTYSLLVSSYSMTVCWENFIAWSSGRGFTLLLTQLSKPSPPYGLSFALQWLCSPSCLGVLPWSSLVFWIWVWMNPTSSLFPGNQSQSSHEPFLTTGAPHIAFRNIMLPLAGPPWGQSLAWCTTWVVYLLLACAPPRSVHIVQILWSSLF